jgi:hypothetical protein
MTLCSLKGFSRRWALSGRSKSETAGTSRTTSGKEIPGSIATRQRLSTRGQNWALRPDDVCVSCIGDFCWPEASCGKLLNCVPDVPHKAGGPSWNESLSDLLQ